MMSQDASKSAQGYLHGFSDHEQARLYKQARFLEHKVYQDIDLAQCKSLLEVGSGVGAQTEILLERFPHLKIDCIDSSQKQVARAEKHLHQAIQNGKVQLHLGDASKLPMAESSMDAAFVCWLLEHVSSPLEILKDVARVLKPNGILYCTEVLNATLYLHPYSPATLQYWFAFNDHQWNLGGDPFVGAKLGHYLQNAGFQDIETKELTFHYDSRSPKIRSAMFDYWTELLLSGAPSMVSSGHATQDLVDAMTQELTALKHDHAAVFYYTAMRASGKVY
jgi:ubiquinone/menaquinone biosynthesis C-methylase UbiE